MRKFLVLFVLAVLPVSLWVGTLPAQDKSYEKVSGYVNSFYAEPGTNQLNVHIDKRIFPYLVSPNEKKSNVTFEDKKVDAAELIGKLISVKLQGRSRVHVVVHPVSERYGTSLEAEFTVKETEK